MRYALQAKMVQPGREAQQDCSLRSRVLNGERAEILEGLDGVLRANQRLAVEGSLLERRREAFEGDGKEDRGSKQVDLQL